jgi:hypothetical protein
MPRPEYSPEVRALAKQVRAKALRNLERSGKTAVRNVPRQAKAGATVTRNGSGQVRATGR